MNTPTPAGIPAAPPLNIPPPPVMDLPTSNAAPQVQEAAPVELSGRSKDISFKFFYCYLKT